MSFTPYDIPPQENKGKWFRSHLLGREIELGELYSLGSNDLDDPRLYNSPSSISLPSK